MIFYPTRVATPNKAISMTIRLGESTFLAVWTTKKWDAIIEGIIEYDWSMIIEHNDSCLFYQHNDIWYYWSSIERSFLSSQSKKKKKTCEELLALFLSWTVAVCQWCVIWIIVPNDKYVSRCMQPPKRIGYIPIGSVYAIHTYIYIYIW